MNSVPAQSLLVHSAREITNRPQTTELVFRHRSKRSHHCRPRNTYRFAQSPSDDPPRRSEVDCCCGRFRRAALSTPSVPLGHLIGTVGAAQVVRPFFVIWHL